MDWYTDRRNITEIMLKISDLFIPNISYTGKPEIQHFMEMGDVMNDVDVIKREVYPQKIDLCSYLSML